MCQFGDESKIISEQKLTREQALVGYRSWYIINSFNDKEKSLKSTNIEFLWPKKKKCLSNPLRENSEGFYNYNICNYNNNYDYYYDYYNSYNYYNKYYNNYKVAGKTLLYGKVFSYSNGYRSSTCIVTHLAVLSDKRWFENEKTVKFAQHFNDIVSNLAKEYNCKTINYDDLIEGK